MFKRIMQFLTLRWLWDRGRTRGARGRGAREAEVEAEVDGGVRCSHSDGKRPPDE